MATKSKKLDKRWLHDHINDPYVKRAQRDAYRSRAAYKLIEIDTALKLLQPGQRVVDLGSAPGAWSQVLRRRLAPDGAAVGVLDGQIFALDVLPMLPIEGVTFLQGDFRDAAVASALDAAVGDRAVDVVVSDMAPNLSGIATSDAARMADLVELAIEFCGRHLHPDGTLVCKAFHGSGYSQLVERFKASFRIVKPIKPKASRAKSAETFLVGVGLKR